MCGIASTFLYPQKRSPQVWEGIRENFTANLLFNEKRGEAATGLAIVNNDGKIRLYKQPLPAHQFVQTETYQNLLREINANTVLILGHTRLPTQGNPQDNRNNHPIQSGSVYGIHNGHIHNDHTLFAQWGWLREAEVDSEIIFRVLADCGDYCLEEVELLSLLQTKFSTFQGKFTFLATDCRIPQRLIVVKHNNPISLHFSPEWNTLIFSSSYIFLRKLFGKVVVNECLPNHHLALFRVEYLLELKSVPWKILPLEVVG
jgi:glucosamine 6-phosphate synthetase-like amidotransferase/phosphosugar isomerase protein